MKLQKRNGEVVEIVVREPKDLDDAIGLFGPSAVFRLFSAQYRIAAKRAAEERLAANVPDALNLSKWSPFQRDDDRRAAKLAALAAKLAELSPEDRAEAARLALEGR